MKRRDVIKSLTLLPAAGNILKKQSFLLTPLSGDKPETKNTFRVVNLALDQIKKNNAMIELALTLTASDIERINKKGNVAHASNEAILQSVAASRHPMIYSHGGFHKIVDHPRCITDEAAKAIAAKGGVIGVHFGSLFNNPKYWAWQKPNNPIRVQPNPQPKTPRILNSQVTTQTIEDVDKEFARELPFTFKGTIPDQYWMRVDQLAKVIDYGINLVGEDHIALGSDLDGGPELPREIKDISDFPQITMAMQKLGYTDQRIKKVLGLNWLRVIRQVTEGK